MDALLKKVLARLEHAAGLWLFLDYDGTLADFAPTPDEVIPDPELILLFEQLSKQPHTRVSVISGRRLGHIQKLLPVDGILLAGTYGIELQLFDGEKVERLAYTTLRPVLKALKPTWQGLIAERKGFYLEDKGWALAIHARYALQDETRWVLNQAQAAAERVVPAENFHLYRDEQFLEVGPQLAHKGKAVTHLLERFSWPEALLLYFGDDDKDEDAFEVIEAHNGITVNVSSEPKPTRASTRLASPQAVRNWLRSLIDCIKDY